MPGCENWEMKPSVKEALENFDVRNIIYGAALILAFMLGFAVAGGV